MKLDFKKLQVLGKNVLQIAKHHSPTIFTIAGVALMGAAIVTTISTAPKAQDEIDILNKDEEVSHKEYNKAKARIIVRHYWPIAAMGFGGAGMIFWGHKISLGRTASAIAAYQMSKDNLKKLEDKIIDMDGEKHLKLAKEDILKDEVGEGPKNKEPIFHTGHGTDLCYDAIGKRFFYSDIEHIRQMTGKLNFDLAEQMKYGNYSVASFNDWCDWIGLEPLDGRIQNGSNRMRSVAPNIGKDLGWRNRLVELEFTSMLLPNDEHCLVVGFTEDGAPKWDLDISDDHGCPDCESSDEVERWRGL